MAADPSPTPVVPRRLWLEALGWLLLARVATALLPLRQVLRIWRLEAAQEAAQGAGDELEVSADHLLIPVREAILHHVRGSRFWGGSCMAQSFAAVAMVRRRGLPVTLCLGTARKDNHSWRAHAWLQSGDFLVTGADPTLHGGYTRLAAFGVRGKGSRNGGDL